MEVDGDLEKKTVTIKGNIHIVKLITLFQKKYIHADLIYYKRQGWEEHDDRKESCGEEEEEDYCCRDSDNDEVDDTGANDHEKHFKSKDYDQRKGSHGKKEKKCSCDDDEAENIGADHYRKRNTFKDHKPEAYKPPKQDYFWGDIRSGMHKKFPVMPGNKSWFTAGFPKYYGSYYPAPWPQGDYM